MSRARRIALATALGVAAAIYWLVVRPWHREWGATHGEVQGRLPGDDLVPEPAEEITRAVTVDAPAEEVWPRLVQLGQSRGGVIGAVVSGTAMGSAEANQAHPEQQSLDVGETVRLAPESLPIDSPTTTPEVAVLDDERALVLQSPGRDTYSWAFVLEPDEDGTTRLITRSRARQPESAASLAGARLLAEPIHFAVDRKLLLSMKERAENSEEAQQDADPSEPELGPTI